MLHQTKIMGLLIGAAISLMAVSSAYACSTENIREKILISATGQQTDNGSVVFPFPNHQLDLDSKQLLALSLTQLNAWKAKLGNSSVQVVTATADGDINLECAAHYDAVDGDIDDVGVICRRLPYPSGSPDRVSLRVTYCAR